MIPRWESVAHYDLIKATSLSTSSLFVSEQRYAEFIGDLNALAVLDNLLRTTLECD